MKKLNFKKKCLYALRVFFFFIPLLCVSFCVNGPQTFRNHCVQDDQLPGRDKGQLYSLVVIQKYLTDQSESSILESHVIGYDNRHLAITYETHAHCCISKSENIKHSFKFKDQQDKCIISPYGYEGQRSPIPCVSILGTLGLKGLRGKH